MKKIAYLSAGVTALVLAAACGDDEYEIAEDGDASTSSSSGSSSGARPDASTSSSSGGSSGSSSGALSDAGTDGDAATDPIRTLAIDLQAELAVNAPSAPSSIGYAIGDTPFETGGSSWSYKRTASAGDNQKFEFYLQLNAATGTEKVSPAVAQIHEYLGDITIADIETVKVHSRRNTAASADFSMLVYTEPTGTDDDDTWYHHRLHSELSNSTLIEAPFGEWNEFATGSPINGLRFWDYRDKNIPAGAQPTAETYFSLADMQAGEITPPTLTARDYRTEKIKYLTFASYSTALDFDAALDGIEIVLKNGKGVKLDLTGDSLVRRFSVSHAAVTATDPPSGGSSYGVAQAANSFTGGTSWNFARLPADPALKFEFYVPFTMEAGAASPPGASWDDIRNYMGEFTVGELDSVQFRSRRAAESSSDYSLLIYTTPVAGAADNDKTWYRRKLTAASGFVSDPAHPIENWNLFTTNAGDNQLNFWDFKGIDADPAGTPFSFGEIQAGEVAATTRNYLAEKVKWITLSTFSTETTVDAALDTIEIKLKTGKTAILDLNK